jgi:hypothetical protein
MYANAVSKAADIAIEQRRMLLGAGLGSLADSIR